MLTHNPSLDVLYLVGSHMPGRDPGHIQSSDPFTRLWVRLRSLCVALQGLENLLWAFATLNHNPPLDVLRLAATRLAETLDTFNQQNLALTLWAFARFTFCPSQPILTACAERATELSVVRFCPFCKAQSMRRACH